MPGTFAHITLVDLLCEVTVLERIPELPTECICALTSYMNFCELGAVSPDYPYLALHDNEAKGWANVMHYWKTADMIRNSVRHLPDAGATEARRQCIAWLFGYASHIVADLTIHPVIERIVGEYATHQIDHRVCEMHQDAYIFNHGMGEEIDSAEYLKHAGLRDCGQKAGDTHHLATPVSAFWTRILAEIPLDDVVLPPNICKPSSSPQPDKWHHDYVTKIDSYAEEGKRFFLARGALESVGIVYPPSKNVKQKFIKNLQTPNGTTEDYEEVFERARQNVINIWRELGRAISTANPALVTLANGNLDTGMRDNAQAGESHIFWTA